jgi:hypothetical protein
MHPSPLLAPIVALVGWTIVMLIWMAIARMPLVRDGVADGTRGVDLEAAKPGPRHWPAHNYMHLMEQPTIFYAIVFALILMGFDGRINLYLAWTYVGLRIIHSVIQATINVVRIRVIFFLLSSLCLIALTLHAAVFLMHHG